MRAKNGENYPKVNNYFVELETLLLKKKQIEREIVSNNLTHDEIERITIDHPFSIEFGVVIREIKNLKIKVGNS